MKQDLLTSIDDAPPKRAPISTATLDFILTTQIVVAWAGEAGEEPRLGWWRCDLVNEYGGMDIFKRLLPSTWMWATFQSVREAARRHDAQLRQKAHDPDRIYSIFNLGFELDERVDERLQHHKRTTPNPYDALPALQPVVLDEWDADAFLEWVDGHGVAQHSRTPIGRRLKGEPPTDPERALKRLVAALNAPGDTYPLPHYRRPA